MKKSVLTLLTIIAITAGAFAQSYQWAKRLGSYGVDFGRGMASDAQGNIYVTGQFEFDAYLNGDNAVTFTALGAHDIFVAKYSPTGTLLWARQAGGTGGDAGSGIYVDPSGNVYITGEMEGTSYFGNTTLVCQGSNDIFIAKYNTNGDLQFAAQAGGYSGDRGRGITADPAGNVYVTGEYRQSCSFGSHTVTTSGNYKDFFLAKYNPSSGWEWVRPGGSSVDDQGSAICLDPSGYVYVTGYHGPNSMFGSTPLSTAGGFDMFLAKFSATGSMQWIQRAGGTWDDYGAGLVYNATDNTVYLVGEYRGTSDFGSIVLTETGWGDAFVASYSGATGTPLWVKTAGGSGATDYAKGIALDGSNNLYVTGAYGKSAAFPAPMNGDTSEVFIASYTPSGSLRWVVDAKGSGKEDVGRGITVDASGNVYVVGNYNEYQGTPAANLNVGQAVLTGFSNEDAFILKYSPVMPASVAENKGKFSEFYPNPAHDKLTVRTSVKGELIIQNEIGQIMFNKTVNAGDMENVELTGFGAGMYFVRLSDETRKLIIY